jgi:urease accessory protein
MAAGAVLAFGGYAVPGVEPLIAASVLCLGLGIAARQRVGLIFGAVVVAGFAVFHGMAHAQEQPLAASIAGYAAGFMVSTALLHGIGLLLALRSQAGARLTGLPIAAAGFWMLARSAG